MAECPNCHEPASRCNVQWDIENDNLPSLPLDHTRCERRAKERALAKVSRLRDELDLIEQCAAHALGGPAPLMNGVPKGAAANVCREVVALRAELAEARKPRWVRSGMNRALQRLVLNGVDLASLLELNENQKCRWEWRTPGRAWVAADTEAEAKAAAEKACGAGR